MKTYKISDISIYPFNENGKKFVEEIRCCLNTNEKLTERINNILIMAAIHILTMFQIMVVKKLMDV